MTSMKVTKEYLNMDLLDTENILTDNNCDFTVRYMSVAHIQGIAETYPEIITARTVNTLEQMLLTSDLSHRTRSYFMCKQVAATLCSIIIHSKGMAEYAHNALKRLLSITEGQPHRAVAEAIGSLPVSVCGPVLVDIAEDIPPRISIEDFINRSGLKPDGPFHFIGRSLVCKLKDDHSLLVIKLARSNETPDALRTEAMWINYMGRHLQKDHVRFDIPKIIRIYNGYLLRLSDLPVPPPPDISLHPEGLAIAFSVNEEYFHYPNDRIKGKLPSPERFTEVITRNAFIMGKIISMGIVHQAPVPLFHNRVQMERRRDNGIYEWQRGGRLDRWIDTCRYPNIGFTGLRDFEHLASIKSNTREGLYRYIGMHLLSLFLITGSYFRNREPCKRGFDSKARPVDVRHLFDKTLLKNIINDVFRHYYKGFVGEGFKGDIPVDIEHLATRMIDEMGVDRHMEEILRPADQNEMTDHEFRSFLKSRGLSDEKIRSFTKGKEDIIVYTGPHLGEFNHGISLPELIEAIETMSCLCISGKYSSPLQ